MSPSPLFITYRLPPETDRWIPGDRWIRPVVRRIVRGPPVPSGIDKVFLNLTAGLLKIGEPFRVNRPWREIGPGDRVGVIGRDRPALAGYDRPNPVVAGVALMTHPSEWPTLCRDYPVARYIQHCQWAIDIYRPYYGDKVCAVWPVGIDTDAWRPSTASDREVDFLIYNKIRWNHAEMDRDLVEPLRAHLRSAGLTSEEIRYGAYRPAEYSAALRRCRAMLFICEHESQGLAYQEALSAGVPVLAWDTGEWLDPRRFEWGTPSVPASSVPYFDARCGERFSGLAAFPEILAIFQDRVRAGRYAPRDYILENLTLEGCARRYVSLLNDAAQTA